MTIEAHRQQLVGWMKTVFEKVQEVIINDHVFWEVQGIIEKNPRFKNVPGFFNQWMASTLIHSAAVAIRLQNTTGRNTISLRRVLEDLQQHPEVISRAYFVGLYRKEDGRQDVAHRTFDNIAGDKSGSLNPQRVRGDLRKLQSLSKKIHHYTNMRIAHYDERGLESDIPTFDDLTEALKGLEELVIKYTLITEARSVSRLLPTVQFDWQKVFYFPWIERGMENDSPPSTL